MKSSGQIPLIILLLTLTLSLSACAPGDQAATSTVEPSPTTQLEPSPTPIMPTEPPTSEIPTATSTADLEAFRNALVEALTQTPPDYTTLQACMRNEFWIYEPFAATKFDPAEAIAEFGARLLPASSAISYDLAVEPHSKMDVPLRPGLDAYIYTTGWVDGSYLGVLIIHSSPEGPVWSGLYLATDEPETTEPMRIKFATGATEATLWGSLPAGGIDEYLLYALEGQTMSVTIISPGDNVYLSIYGLSDGIPLVRTAGDATSWKGVLRESQDYSIKAVSSEPVPSYQLVISIPPLATRDPNLYWVPLPYGVCQELEARVATELGVSDTWLETYTPFEDPLTGTTGRGCLVSAGGTGADFSSPQDVFTLLENMLVNIDWTPDPLYDADGPTGTSGAFRRDASLMIVSVGWRPSEVANCPPDQPISACQLTPEERLYDITLSAATR